MTQLEEERRRRAQVALWSYAYEVENDPMVSDERFDRVSLEIDLSIETDRPDLDKWFKDNFSPYTGSWVHSHPDYERLKQLYGQLKHRRKKYAFNT